MPTFEEMQNQYRSSSTIGKQIKEMSNRVTNETFSNATNYRHGKIYDCDCKEIMNKHTGKAEQLEFKFLKTATYTISKDQVEYWVQFRPGVNPEIDYDTSDDQKHRLGYYIDIEDENTGIMEKWLIVGKITAEFDKYNVLKCNYLFEWVDENHLIHECFGVARDRNNYNSWKYRHHAISTARYNRKRS